MSIHCIQYSKFQSTNIENIFGRNLLRRKSRIGLLPMLRSFEVTSILRVTTYFISCDVHQLECRTVQLPVDTYLICYHCHTVHIPQMTSLRVFPYTDNAGEMRSRTTVRREVVVLNTSLHTHPSLAKLANLVMLYPN